MQLVRDQNVGRAAYFATKLDKIADTTLRRPSAARYHLQINHCLHAADSPWTKSTAGSLSYATKILTRMNTD